MSYYGFIENIWELDYVKFQVPVFDCRWVDNKNGVKEDSFGFIGVDLNKIGYKDDSFILASQARQVFYIQDPADNRRSIVIKTNKILGDEELNDGGTDDEDDVVLGIEDAVVDEGDEPLYRRYDHTDGIEWDQSFEDTETTNLQAVGKRKRH